MLPGMGKLYDIVSAPFRAAASIGSAVTSYLFGSKGRDRDDGDSRDDDGPSEGEKFFARLLQSWGYLGSGPGGWSQDRAMQVARFRGWVFCGVKAIMEAVAELPVQVAWRRSPEEAQKDRQRGKAWNYIKQNSRLRKKAMARLQGNEELELVPRDHPLLRLLHNPNPGDTYETFHQKMVMYGELTGNIFIWIAARNRLGQPTELWVLPSHWVFAVPQTQEEKDRGELVSNYEIRPYGVRSENAILPAADIIHIAYPHPGAPLDGFSPLSAGAPWIDTAESIDVARFAAMKQGIWPGLILSLLPEVGDPDPETRDRLRERFRQHFGGADKFGKPLVLSPGMKVEQSTRNPTDMDFVNGSDQMRDWILALLRVPKAILGITAEVNRASMEAAIALFYRGCVKPKLRFINGVLTEKLAWQFDPTLLLFHPDPTPDDPDQLNADLEIDLRNGVRTLNEARAIRGYEPYEHGGDDPILPATVVVVPLNTGRSDVGGGGVGGAAGSLEELVSQIAALRKPVDDGHDHGDDEQEQEQDDAADGDGTEGGDE